MLRKIRCFSIWNERENMWQNFFSCFPYWKKKMENMKLSLKIEKIGYRIEFLETVRFTKFYRVTYKKRKTNKQKQKERKGKKKLDGVNSSEVWWVNFLWVYSTLAKYVNLISFSILWIELRLNVNLSVNKTVSFFFYPRSVLLLTNYRIGESILQTRTLPIFFLGALKIPKSL